MVLLPAFALPSPLLSPRRGSILKVFRQQTEEGHASLNVQFYVLHTVDN